MANYVQAGDSFDYTPSGADVAAGEIVVLTDMVGVALTPIADGKLGALKVEGVFALPKASGTTFTIGDTVHYDTSTELCVVASATNTLEVGKAARAAVSGEVVVQTKLIP